LARVQVEVEYASEFRYRNPIIGEGDVVFALSQSGETADTLAAIEMAKDRQALIYGICNVVGSSIPRASHAGAYTHAGPEIGVASTKAFTAQVAILTLWAFGFAEIRGKATKQDLRIAFAELEAIPEKVAKTLKCEAQIMELAKAFQDAHNFLYLGRGYGFPVALEGALKLKEISYLHAEGYPAAEMKHGPIALIDADMPVVFVAPRDEVYAKVITNMQEVKARGGRIIAITTNGNGTERLDALVNHRLCVPATAPLLSPIVTTVPLQLLAYHIAVR